MRLADIPAAMRLKEAAGWNQIEQDWANVLAMEPEGCWVEELDGNVVGSTTAVCYGQELAWIGMVLVAPAFRGRGLARGLMEYALRWLEGRGLRQVKLDATDMGRPLYEKLGFRDERLIERWLGWRKEDGPAAPGASVLPLLQIAELDRGTFGVDRTRLLGRLLEVFPGQGVWEAGGFVLGRPGSNAYFLGPCAAADAQTAKRLVQGLVRQAPAKSFFWDLFPDVPAAVEVARELGFERRRQLVRMTLRPEAPLRGQPERVFGAAGFEYG
ncbi:MAG: GNAT family N-acetyltransferase [Acidobacteria bacterium]|nr:GNAT family N-acetyltransferase [Acidobacteriota bacterium]